MNIIIIIIIIIIIHFIYKALYIQKNLKVLTFKNKKKRKTAQFNTLKPRKNECFNKKVGF